MTAARHARPATRPSLEVNEARIWATNQGADWWNLWRARMEPAGRITVITASMGGDRVLVACDSKEDATWLRDHMISEGIHKNAVKLVDTASPLLALAVTLAVLAALIGQARLGGNIAPAAPWHYPCTEHLVHLGRQVIEFFTPNRLLMRGDCLQ